jgi:hypothetical protein
MSQWTGSLREGRITTVFQRSGKEAAGIGMTTALVALVTRHFLPFLLE